MKICLITSTRADFGLLKNLISELLKNNFNCKLIACGTHFAKVYGKTFTEIQNSKIYIDKKIKIPLKKDNAQGIAFSMSQHLPRVANALNELKPDLVIVLGDRYEILAATISAYISRIPIAHIHGGEVTQGVLDDAFRHSITKMSHIHFVANKIYKNRVIQLGESPKNIHVVGGLGVDSIKKVNFFSKETLEKKFKIKFKRKNLLINFHPETIEKRKTILHIKELLAALKRLKDTLLIFTSPGADLENKIIIKHIKTFVNNNSNAFFYKSLGQDNYYSFLNFIDGVIGNSSSGLLEVPTFKKATINIGNRQAGRLLSKSVINVSIKRAAILKSINKIYSHKFQKIIQKSNNPYGKFGASVRIVKIIKRLRLNNLFNKKFYDLKNK
jgi:GDP/UDP-N,N'-diacetylbacillosamine 2-epimerase (hydrolysing)